MAPGPTSRRAAVLGRPVAHSLSPVLHAAAYADLGLDWVYERVECDEAALPSWVGGRDPSWVGLSVTMPGKRAALVTAVTATDRARAVGAANTLTRRADGGWDADCTDVDGVSGALGAAGAGACGAAVVLGAGATGAAAVAGLAALGTRTVTVVVRDPARAAGALAAAGNLGITAHAVPWASSAAAAAGADALVNTTPAGAADAHAGPLVAALTPGAVVLDAVYHPWPTRLAAAAGERGLAVATGLDMLLHQAFGQVEQFTGAPAPREVMRAALAEATGFRLAPLP